MMLTCLNAGIIQLENSITLTRYLTITFALTFYSNENLDEYLKVSSLQFVEEHSI